MEISKPLNSGAIYLARDTGSAEAMVDWLSLAVAGIETLVKGRA